MNKNKIYALGVPLSSNDYYTVGINNVIEIYESDKKDEYNSIYIIKFNDGHEIKVIGNRQNLIIYENFEGI